MADVLTIKADDPGVLSQYHKQKMEFRFQQKSDNDFVMFLLDTAVRVVSIVQHLSPILEVVSASSDSPEDKTDNSSPIMGSLHSSLVCGEYNKLTENSLKPQLTVPHIDLNQYKSPSSTSDLDKTISQIQKQLDSVSASLAESSALPLLTPADHPNSETDKLLKTIMEGNIVNQNVEVMGDMCKRGGGGGEVQVKMEEDENDMAEEGDSDGDGEIRNGPSSHQQHVLQHSDRIEQLMNTLNNHNTSVVSSGCGTIQTTGFNSTSTPILSTSTIKPCLESLKSDNNPLSMLHLQRIQNLSSNLNNTNKQQKDPSSQLSSSPVDQTAILDVLYNQKNSASVPGLKTESTDICTSNLNEKSGDYSDLPELCFEPYNSKKFASLGAPLQDRTSKSDWEGVLDYIQTHKFPNDSHAELQELWMRAIYERYRLERGLKFLTPPQRYRLRKRYPIPATISSTKYKPNKMHSHEVRYELDMLYQKTKYPNSHQISHVSITTGLTRQQVLNYFKNKRSRCPGYNKASANVDIMVSTTTKSDVVDTVARHPPSVLCPTAASVTNPDPDSINPDNDSTNPCSNTINTTDNDTTANETDLETSTCSDLNMDQADGNTSCNEMETDEPDTPFGECSSSNLETIISNVKLSCLRSAKNNPPQQEPLQ